MSYFPERDRINVSALRVVQQASGTTKYYLAGRRTTRDKFWKCYDRAERRTAMGEVKNGRLYTRTELVVRIGWNLED